MENGKLKIKIKNLKLEIGNWKLHQGFTLVELIIYMGLLGIFLIILTDIFVSMLNVKGKTEAVSYVEQDGRFILSRFGYDIPQASSITIPQNLGESGNSLVMVVNGSTYTYSLVSNNLQLNNGSTTENLNSSETEITAITFQKIGNSGGKNTVKIQFTIESITQTTTGAETKTFTTTIGRR
ncbi:hypothetical protein A2164_03085 [Candidatus Curtissbacteria bacterium RBG_13_35_7]|uniref:Prepilin-type N-terminal cleavage/methylation domain-containing protein n=1 Tax=Candidatus Curtissbacteria bacterium RBG_13_35_7 TaxID=1797705 RepID=A0A1F5G1E7_9BACT|nr:MAG: hypothetical protein A2164_03085 [Candidatus Curtissbacteria bacterium RBG_13_35_7]